MYYFILILPFVVFIASSVYLNKKKINESNLYIILMSLFEALLSYLFVFAFFLQGFLPRFIFFSVAFIALIILGCLFFFLRKDSPDEWDLQLETIKNNILIFLKSFLPFFLFLTIFRFWHPILQIIISLVLTFSLIIGAKILRIIYKDKFSRFMTYLKMSNPLKISFLWIAIIIFAIFNTIFKLPSDHIKSFFNLNDNSEYLVFNDMPIDIQNNYRQKNLVSLKINYDFDGIIIDYYYENEFLYLLTNRDRLIIYNVDDKEILSEIDFQDSYVIDSSRGFIYNEYYDYFVKVDNQILVFTLSGVYKVDGSNIEQINDYSSMYSKHYTLDGNLYLAYHIDADNYRIYKYENNDFILNKSYNRSSLSFEKLVIISDSLFRVKESRIYLDSNLSINFKYYPYYNSIYVDDIKTIFYTKYYSDIDVSIYNIDNYTEYIKQDYNGNTEKLVIDDQHSSKIVYGDGRIYTTGFKRMEVIGNDFSFEAMYNHIDIYAFWREFKYSISRIQFSVLENGNLEFLQTEYNDKNVIVQVNQIYEDSSYLKLPFYSHYGILTFIPILLAMLYDITDYQKTITIISFKTFIEDNKKAIR